MSMKRVCDRCGRVKELNDMYSNIVFTKCWLGEKPGDQSISSTRIEHDLCEECREKYELFIGGHDIILPIDEHKEEEV